MGFETGPDGQLSAIIEENQGPPSKKRLDLTLH
jgi:hypothetical protein